MSRQFLVALALSACTVSIHAVGTYANLLWILSVLKNWRPVTMIRAFWIMLGLITVLLLLHVLEVAVWAQFYVSRQCFPDTETAYYYSLVTYTTLGQGDVLLPHAWRITGACEAVIGVLMFGWSTAALVGFAHYIHDTTVRSFFRAT